MAAEVQPEERWRADAEARLASLAKPPGALGTLEDWCVTLCVAQKTLRPCLGSAAAALVFVADHDDDGFECLGAQTAEERAVESRRAAEAEGRVLEIPESPPPSPSPRRPFSLATFVAETNNRHPALVPLPPVPTFMGRGTARRPVEAPAPAPSYGAMVGNQGVPEPRPVDEDADGGVFADY